MNTAPVTICLPTADRRRAHSFYTDGLGLTAIGELAEDGVPEPLQFTLNDGLRLMLIPTGGFGWIIGGRPVGEDTSSECVISLEADDNTEVDRVTREAQTAGAQILTAPAAHPWGYTATFTDPDGHVWQIMAKH